MAFYDDRKFLLSHIRHSFITCDDSGICEMAMINEIMPHHLPDERDAEFLDGMCLCIGTAVSHPVIQRPGSVTYRHPLLMSPPPLRVLLSCLSAIVLDVVVVHESLVRTLSVATSLMSYNQNSFPANPSHAFAVMCHSTPSLLSP